MSGKRAAIILAAGQGKRMKSALPKVLHPVGGRPLLDWSIALARDVSCERIVVVTAQGAEAVRQRVETLLGAGASAIQDPPLGTGHAVRAAENKFTDFEGDVLVHFGDAPLVRAETVQAMFAARSNGASVVVLGFRAADPAGYGRIIRDGAGAVIRIVEDKDASETERRETLCNAGLVVADAKALFHLLSLLRNDNAQGEFYLPDVAGLARAGDMKVAFVEADEAEVMGVNSRAQLADAEAAFQARKRAAFLEAGVTMIDPASVFLSYDTEIAADVTIEPHVFFGPGVKVAGGAHIHAYCHFTQAEIGENAEMGPFARLRPGAKIGRKAKIGNFVEVKNANIGEGAKASHLAYVGDADVGARANLGAGTITCNYDGFFKHRTTIGEDVFIGSDTALVAPVKVGDRAYTGAGSVITTDVPAGALGVARGRQRNLDGWADTFRAAQAAKKKAKKGEP